MRSVVRTVGALAALISVFSTSADAQTSPAPASPGPVAISFVGGVATGGSATGGAIGGTFTFDVSPRLTIETTGTYMDRGRGADAVYGNVALLVNLLPAGSKAVPYATLGGGVYYARFDLDDPHILGAMSMVRAGTPVGVQMPGFGALIDVGLMPRFYAQRLRPLIWPPPDWRWGRRSFTDPVLTLGGGVRLDLTPHLALRPDVRALVLFGDGRSATQGLFSLSVGYRF